MMKAAGSSIEWHLAKGFIYFEDIHFWIYLIYQFRKGWLEGMQILP